MYGDLVTDGDFDVHRYDPDADTLTNISNLPAGTGALGVRPSPDGQWVVYQSTRQAGRQLDVSPLDGTTFTEVSPPSTIPGVLYREFEWSPDSSRIAYVANSEIADANEVFLVDRDGSNPQKISGPVGSPASVELTRIQWSPDGRYIAQMVRSKSSGSIIGINTHDTQAGGFSSVRLNPAVAAGGSISRYHWAPDSSRIVYQGQQDFADRTEVYTVRPDGTDHRKVSIDLSQGGFSVAPAWSPDSTRIVYQADPDGLDRSEVIVVNADGSETVRINGPLNAGQRSGSPAWSPDGTSLMYLSNEDGSADTFDIFTTSPDGLNNTKVNVPLVVSGGPRFAAWSPDSTRIAYFGAAVDADVFELYTVRPDGSESLRVSGPMVAGGSVYTIPGFVDPPRWSSDSSRILYSADQETDELIEMFTVRTDASENLKLSPTFGPTESLFDFGKEWSHDSSAVAFLGEIDATGERELYIATADGVTIEKVSGTLPVGGSVLFAIWID